MKVDARQVISRDVLDQLAIAANAEVDNLLRSINNNETSPLKLSSTGVDRIVSIGSIFVTNPETAKNRTIPTISNTLPNFTSGTIAVPATGAGTITVSPGTNLVIAMIASQFQKIGINVDAAGSVTLVAGTAAASLAAATAPPGIKNTFGVGYFVVRTDGSNNVANILLSDIYQYVGGGGSGGGDANSFLETIKANLRDGTWQLATPNIFSSVGSTLIDGTSTATYSLVTQNVGFSAASQFMLSTQSLDANEFLTAERDIASVQLMTQWATGFIDPAATYQVSRDGGANFQTVTMARIGTTDTFVGTQVFTTEPSSASLAAQAIVSAQDNFNSDVNPVATQTDGKILVGGSFTLLDGITRNRLVRLNASGIEDSAFYTNLGTGFNDQIRAIATQTDGKILVGGDFTTLNAVTRISLVRLNSDGTVDTAFYTNLGTGFDLKVRGLTVQTDGKILVGGAFTTLNGITRNRFVRLNSDGTVDTAFYTNLGTGFNSDISNSAVQTDGKILVGGFFTSLNGSGRAYLVRLNSDGTHDGAFYTNISNVTTVAFSDPVLTIAIQTDGKILVGGQFTTLNGSTRNYFVRLNSDGTVDTTFYTNLGTGFNTDVSNSTIQTDGKILVGGRFTTLNGITRNRFVRLNSDGTVDTTFYTNLGTGFNATASLAGRSVAIQTDGKILVGGSFTTLNGITRNRLVRLNSNGTEDTSLVSLSTYLNTTTQQKVAQTIVLANAAVLKTIDLFVSSIGTPLGNIYIQIVRDSGGFPSTSLSDLMSESKPISAAGLVSGLNTITLPDTVAQAGTYHVVIRTDAAYQAQFTSSAGASSIGIQTSSTDNGSTQYNGTVWSDPGTTAFKFTLSGRVLNLRVKVISSTSNVQLMGTGILYDIQTSGIVGGLKHRQVFKFNSTANPSTFALTMFRPDPDLLGVYLVETGQVFRAPAFTLSGNTVVFPANSFNNGGVPADLTLVMDQTNGTSFDNSDMNALLLAGNFLGSADATIDRSVAGRGIFLRSPNGTLREITINDEDQIVVYSI